MYSVLAFAGQPLMLALVTSSTRNDERSILHCIYSSNNRGKYAWSPFNGEIAAGQAHKGISEPMNVTHTLK